MIRYDVLASQVNSNKMLFALNNCNKMLFENQNQTQNLSCTGHKNIQLTQDAKLIQVLLHPFIKKNQLC